MNAGQSSTVERAKTWVTGRAPHAERLRLLRSVSSIALVGLIFFIILRLTMQALDAVHVLSVAIAFVFAGWVLAWRDKCFALAANLTVLGGMIAVGASHVRDGLIASPSLWVVSVVPFAAGLLLGPRAVIGHTVVAGLFISAAWLGPILGVDYPQQLVLPPMDWLVLRVLALVIVLAVGIKIVESTEASVFEIARRKVAVSQAHLKAQALDAEKTRFLNQMSHEIRTPMNGIKGMVQHWRRQALRGELKESVEVMDRCADHLTALMRDIQDLSKIERGDVDVFAHPFLVNAAVQDVVRMFEAKAKHKGLVLESSGPGEERWVLGDRQRVVQVLSNLVGNAVKFTDQGTVCVRWNLSDTGVANFSVIDEGIGMSSSQVEQLFQKYGQVDLDEGVARGGTGLGLTISKALSEAMGGDLLVTSQMGEGSTFCFTLTLPQVEAPQARLRGVKEGAQVQQGLKVLVVDDDPASLRVQSLALEAMGMSVRACLSGPEALEATAASTFDLIVMDLRLPERDGVALTRTIRGQSKRHASTPVIAITASAYVEDRQRCLDAGMRDVILKPFRFETLERSVLECIRPHQEEAA